MSREEAEQVFAALRDGRKFERSNSMYGSWSFAYLPAVGKIRYQSNFWGDDPEHPTIVDEELDHDAFIERMMTTYTFEDFRWL